MEDTEVSLSLSGVSLRNIIGVLLQQHPDNALDFVIRNGVMQIVTVEAAEEMVEPRVYGVGHLKHIQPEALAELIQGSIQPRTWRQSPSNRSAVGGASKKKTVFRNGFIASVNGALVITHTQRVHHEIAQLLDQLKRQAEDVK